MRALNILSAQAENPKFARILRNVRDDVEQGISLADAFKKHSKVFDRLFISMVKAGETGGVLDEVLNRISGFMEYRAKLTAKVKSAMAYPTVVTVFSVIIFFVMLTFVLPRFSTIFSRLGGDLPAYTQFLVNISEFLRSSGSIFLAIAMVSIFFGLRRLLFNRKGKIFLRFIAS